MCLRQLATLFLTGYLVFFQDLSAAEVRVPLSPGELLYPVIREPGVPRQEGSVGLGLHILVIEGEDGVNIIKKKTAVRPVVEVRDRNNLPVAGALVTFSSPDSGPSVTFLNGSHSVTAVTEANGRAAVQGLKPLNTGQFQIKVSVSYREQAAAATITMTNVLTAAEAAGLGGGAAVGAASGGGGMSGATIAIIVGVAAAAAVGISVGLLNHGGAAASSSATIGVGGTGSVGAPH